MKSGLFKISLVLIIVAVLIAGCAPEKIVEKVEVTRVVEKEGEKVVEVITATPLPVVEKTLKVAMIMPSSSKDMAFSESMFAAVQAVQKEMGGESKMELKYSENMFKVPDAAAALRDYATQGYEIVIGHGSQYGSSIAQIAPDFPEVSFAHGTTANTFNSEGITNVFAYEARSQDAGYIFGVEMAMLSKSGQIGWCGPVNTGDHGLFFKGLKQGVEAANAETKKNVKILEAWTGNYSDVSLMTACAETHIKAGADVITGGAQAFVGAIGVCKDNNVLVFGSQWDQASLAPDVLVASYVYDWTGVIKDIIASHNAGVMGGKVYTATFQNGGLVIKYNDKFKLADDVKAAGDKALAGLKSGEIKVDLTK